MISRRKFNHDFDEDDELKEIAPGLEEEDYL